MRFTYDLPPQRIAQWPVEGERSKSKLLRLKPSSEIVDANFSELRQFLKPGDVLVLNNTKVQPRRFFANLNGKEIEVLLLEQKDEVWEALAKPMRKLAVGDVLELTAEVKAEVLGRTEDQRRIKLKITEAQVAELGLMPIPPYIRDGRSEDKDKERYQTVFAENAGSVAAPTAGLHFTKELLEELKNKGVQICYLTLHVGPASFLAVSDEVFEGTELSKEFYHVADDTRQIIRNAKKEGRRIVAVGTTVMRSLESLDLNQQDAGFKETKLFIKPGFEFKVVDALLTNFHQPGSSHLLLVEAFIGRENIEKVYQHGLENNYRFLSYGDGSFFEKICE